MIFSLRYPLLQLNGDDELESYVAPHIVDTTATRDGILVGILQTTEVVLVSLIQQVVGSNVQFGNLLTTNHHVGTCREREQGIGRRLRLCIVSTVDMALTKIVVETCSNIEIVE